MALPAGHSFADLQGADLPGAASFSVRLTPTDGATVTPAMIQQTVEALRKRVDSLGFSKAVVTPQSPDRVQVQIPGLDAKKVNEARETLRTAKLEFRLVHPESQKLIPRIEAGQTVIPPGYVIKSLETEWKGKKTTEKLLVNQKTALDGSHLAQAGAVFDQEGWSVNLTFDPEGAKQFGLLTKQV